MSTRTVINFCIECGDSFATDAKWKNTCYKCYLKEQHPEQYSNQYEIQDIKCERCGELFSGEGWKTLCVGCWIKDLNEKKQKDLEEREHFK